MNKQFWWGLWVAFFLIQFNYTSAVAQATYTVNTPIDEDLDNANCSLREALTASNTNTAYNGCIPVGTPGADTIEFDPGLTGATVLLLTGELRIDDDLIINGLGRDHLTLDGNRNGRVFRVGEQTQVELNDLHITNALAGFSAGVGITHNAEVVIRNSLIDHNEANEKGGGIGMDPGTQVTIINTTIAHNRAGGGFTQQGGGINTVGNLTLIQSTVSHNEAFNHGGGIFITGGEVQVQNSTISNNTALNQNGTDGGGGMFLVKGSATLESTTLTQNQASGRGGGILTRPTFQLKSTLVAGNTLLASTGGAVSTLPDSAVAYTYAGNGGPDLSGSFISQGFNLVGDPEGFNGLSDGVNNDQVGVTDPGLEVLADNGGDTETHALMAASPALDTGSCAGLLMDQRGGGSDCRFNVT